MIMTTEDKAKAYDKAIERTRRMIEYYKNRGLENYIACAKENIDYIFPELKESEGESMKESLIAFFRKYPYSIGDAGINPLDAIAWLEKQGEQKPVGFNIGDEITVNGQICRVVAIDKPAVWSEEDESKIRHLIAFLNTNPNSVIYSRPKEEWIAWLKSLRPHKTWKPSDEQIKQLGWIAGKNKDNMIGKELMSLYQDLKKLK